MSGGSPDLATALAEIPDPQGRQGRQYPALPMLLAIVYVLLCGKRHLAASAEWVAVHYQDWLRNTLGFSRPMHPCRATFRLFLRRLDGRALETALRGWITAVATARGVPFAPETVAVDGKEARGIRRISAEALLLVSAFTDATGLTLALRTCPEGGQPAAVRVLFTELAMGCGVMADALHTQRETCHLILDRENDYVLSAKENQPQRDAALRDLLAPWQAATQDRDWVTTTNAGHGWLKTCTLVAVSVPDGKPDWPGVQQVFCLTRSVRQHRDAEPTREVVYGITSLPPIVG